MRVSYDRALSSVAETENEQFCHLANWIGERILIMIECVAHG